MAKKIEKKILRLWRSPDFSGAFSGALNFKNALEFEKGIKIPIRDLYTILRKDPDYVLELKQKRKRFERREMKVHGVSILWQADLAIMPSHDNYSAFLLCVDVFSRHIFCEPLKNKSAVTVRKAFRKIFRESKLKPAKIECDKGAEFVANKSFFQKEKIFFKTKIGRHKASYAERSIQIVKQRLYRLLRTLLTNDWPKYLQQIVKGINNSPHKAIGGLRPSEITKRTDGPKIDAAVGVPEDVSFQEQEDNQKKYEREKRNIQVNDYVHVDFGPSTFERGFDSKNYQLFKVIRVDAGKKPYLYKLADLKDAEVSGYFYATELTKVPPPKPNATFRVEKILDTKIENGKKMYYVKFTHYPRKFNTWIPAKNFVK